MSGSSARLLLQEVVLRVVKRVSAVVTFALIICGAAVAQGERVAPLNASRAQWQAGDAGGSLATIEQALKVGITADLAYQKASLLEASGDDDGAREWYGQALNLSTESKQQAQLRLRLTLIDLTYRDASRLVDLAGRGGRESGNRAAIVLALFGHYDHAVRLYTVAGAGVDLFRQHLRLAQWGLQSANPAAAQEHAWQASRLATQLPDRRYALSLLAEAHYADRSQERLLQRLSAEKKLTEEEQDLRVEVLSNLGRYDEAIELFRRSSAALSVESRRRLLRMYADAGRESEMAAEYRRLIASEPGEVAWPEGFAQQLIEDGDIEGGREVWREFVARTKDPAVLLSGARSMARFGMDELADSAADKAASLDSSRVVEVGLFRFDLLRSRGDTAGATRMLADIDRALAANDKRRIELSYAYERARDPQQSVRILEDLKGQLRGALGRDERIRLAWLYDSTGRRHEALKEWQSLWEESDSEAARRMIEDRLIALAAETGALGELAVDLESRLAAGKARKQDAALLVRIYTEVDDSTSAVEVIEESFATRSGDRTATIASLREQARVYRALDEGRAFRKVTSRLLELDPANASDYLQGLILSRVESAAAAAEDPEGRELRTWLQQLRETNSGAGPEFEAGVLALAGLNGEAIEVYRRALASNPRQGDLHLLLADLLKKASREAEALAGLQYLVESASEDDMFLAGIDGILNLQSRDPRVVRWAQRRVLERLATREDRAYLHGVLAELAEEARDLSLYFATLEDSLVEANGQRSNVLRELIAASSDEGRSQFREPDLNRSVRYSRRLIALGDALPPEVYLGMGRTFLTLGDPSHAAQAFNLALDRTGEASLLEQTGDLFDQAGYLREAAGQYQKALIGDADSLTIQGKLATLRLGEGNQAEAHALYLHGLLDVLNSQPIEVAAAGADTVADLSTSTTAAYRGNYRLLLSGVIATLPNEGADATFAAVTKAMAAATTAAIGDGNAKAPRKLVFYPRLNVISMFARELGLRTGRNALVDRLDTQLLARFSDDRDLQSLLDLQRRRWGLAPLAAMSVDDEAAEHRVHEQELALARLRTDPSQALVVYRDWFRSLLKRQHEDASAESLASAVDVVLHARSHLDPERYLAFCRFMMESVRARPASARDLLYSGGSAFIDEQSSNSLLLHLEKVTGREWLTDAQVKRILAEVPAPIIGALDGIYVTSRLPQDQQVEEFRRVLAGNAEGDVEWMSVRGVLQAILARPLTERNAVRVDELFKERLAQVNIARGASLGAAFFMLSQARFGAAIHERNIPLIDAWDSYLARTYPAMAQPGILRINLLRDLGRGREAVPLAIDAALAQYGRRPFGTGAAALSVAPSATEDADQMRRGMIASLSAAAEWIFPAYRADAIAALDRREQELGATPAVLNLQALLRVLDPQLDSLAVTEWLNSKLAQHPDNPELLRYMASVRSLAGEAPASGDSTAAPIAAAQSASAGVVSSAAAPASVVAAASAGVPAAAGAAADVAVPLDLSAASAAAASPTSSVNAASSIEARPVVDPDERALRDIYALESGGDAQVAQAALRLLMLRWMLLWDATLFPPDLQFGFSVNLSYSSSSLIEQRWGGERISSSTSGDFFERLAQYDLAVPEIEAQLWATDPTSTDRLHPLYEALAGAYRRTGRDAEKIRQLAEQLEAGTAGGKELVLWLQLLNGLPVAQIRDYLPLAERRLSKAAPATTYARMLMAHLYAASGMDEQAVLSYQQALIARIVPLRPFGMVSTHLTAMRLYNDAREHLDADASEQVLTGFLRIVAPDGGRNQRDDYARFLMGVLDSNPDSAVADAELQTLLIGDTAITQPADLLRAARLQASRQRYPAALGLLRAALAHRLNAPDLPNSAGVGLVDRQYMSLREISVSYEVLLGAPGNNGRPRTARQILETLFVAAGQDEHTRNEWTGLVSSAVATWIERHEINRDAGAELLQLVGEHRISQTPPPSNP